MKLLYITSLLRLPVVFLELSSALDKVYGSIANAILPNDSSAPTRYSPSNLGSSSSVYLAFGTCAASA